MKQNSLFGDLLKAFRYMTDSKRGKYSLATYLEIIGEYADRQIIGERERGLTYSGGECTVYKDSSQKQYVFSVEMFFVDPCGPNIKKTACRRLEISRFTKETSDEISSEKLHFNIEEPKG